MSIKREPHFMVELERARLCLKLAQDAYKEGLSIKAVCGKIRTARRHIATAETLAIKEHEDAATLQH
jgi:hypothetical protein